MTVHAKTTISISETEEINVWASTPDDPKVGIEIVCGEDGCQYAYISAEQVDELIRALAAARVEISKARPS